MRFLKSNQDITRRNVSSESLSLIVNKTTANTLQSSESIEDDRNRRQLCHMVEMPKLFPPMPTHQGLRPNVEIIRIAVCLMEGSADPESID